MATMKKMVAKKAPKKYAMGGSMTTTTETTKGPKKVVKSKEDKYTKLGGEIGNPPFSKKDWAEKKKITGMKAGGKVMKAKPKTVVSKKPMPKTIAPKMPSLGAAPMMKKGGKMKTCKGGC